MNWLDLISRIFQKKPFVAVPDISHLGPDLPAPTPVVQAPVATPAAPIVAPPAPVVGRAPASTMRLSAKGRAFIRQEEGERLYAYKDSVGVWTIGVGHTGPDVFPGKTITTAESDALLQADAIKHCKPICDLVTVPITQNEFDAMSSLAFNIGVNGFARSSVLRLLNAGDRAGAANAFMMWVKPPELTGRRKREVALFLSK